MSGMEMPGQYRFVTLTSSPESPRRPQESWRILKERLKRRDLLEAYFMVPEYSRTGSGLVHLHLIFRGRWISQKWLSEQWGEIHKAPIVWIEKVRDRRRAVIGYICKYVAKDLPLRWSCSWTWVCRGFCKIWEHWKRVGEAWRMDRKRQVLAIWRIHIKAGLVHWLWDAG